MKFKLTIASMLATMLLGGCAGTAIGLHSTNSPSLPGGPPAPGSSYSSASIQVDVTPGALLGLILFGYLVGGVPDDYRRSSGGASWQKPPEMAEGRAIAERDCSQPLGHLEANLRCK